MTDTARPDGGRAALAGFVTNRLGRATPRPAPVKTASPAGKSAAQNFENLPGYRELKLHRQAADLIGLGNPFFRVHDAKAGATTRIDQKSFTNFSSYDYLGLNGHPRVSNAAREAIEAYGTSASASRVVAGERGTGRVRDGRPGGEDAGPVHGRPYGEGRDAAAAAAAGGLLRGGR